MKYSAGLYNTSGMTRQEARTLIQSEANRLADILTKEGFDVTTQHSGSAAGPSSYLSVSCPHTGIYDNSVRISDHSKGVFNSNLVANIAGDDDFNEFVGRMKKRKIIKQGESGYISLVQVEKANREYKDQEFTEKMKLAKELKSRQDAGEAFTGKNKKLIKQYEHELKMGRI